MRWPVVVAATAILTACETAPRTQNVKTPVPIECRVQRPDRPAMPTEALSPGADVDTFARAAMAEIDLREAYEIKLSAALDVCTAPLER